MTKVFEIKDKTGRKVYLTKERWRHICKEHDRLSSRLETIKRILVNPLTINESKYDENVRHYYKYFKELKKYLMISVKYLNGKGYIITAFYTSKLEK